MQRNKWESIHWLNCIDPAGFYNPVRRTLMEELSNSNFTPDFFQLPLSNILQTRAVFLVGGFLNELAGTILRFYYSDFKSVLYKNHIPYYCTGYPSGTSFAINTNSLYHDLSTYHQTIRRPIILIGHSMGGAESLLLVLKHFELIMLNIIEKVVLITPAIGGSPVAEHLTGRVIGPLLERFFARGLHSLTPSVSQQIFGSAMEEFRKNPADVFHTIDRCVFYIRCATNRPLGADLRIATSFCDMSRLAGIPNDGLLPLDAQILPGIGRDLGVLNSDHIGPVIGSGVLSSESSHMRAAFARTVLRLIYGFGVDQIQI